MRSPSTPLGFVPWRLTCRDLDCTLIHFSTDYVFGLDATRDSPYVEDDSAGPMNVYGVSKWAGEALVRSLCPKHLIVRTCGLYGTSGQGSKRSNFVETMLRKGAAGHPVRVVHDPVCTPTATFDLVRARVNCSPRKRMVSIT